MSDPLLVEVGLGAGDWANISDRIRTDSPITIIRGLQSEDGIAGPSSCTLSLDNHDGLFSVRDPMSPLYGLLNRNSRIRVSYGRGAFGMVLTGSNGRAETPDAPALGFTGDLDVRVDLELLATSDTSADWTWPGAGFDLASKWTFFVGGFSWAFLTLAGKLRLLWTTTGATVTNSADSTVTLPGPNLGRRAVRFTLDVDNGSGGKTVTFYTAPTMAGPWTVLGAPVTTAGTTSVFDSNGAVRIGASSGFDGWTWGRSAKATVYAAEVRNGINGTVVASPTFTTRPLDTNPFSSTVFNDAQSNPWTFTGSSDAARIWYGDVDIRCDQELATLPPRMSLDLNNKWVPISANGILRRLSQGKAPTESGSRSFALANAGSLAAYYPLDAKEGTTYTLNLAPQNRYLSTRFEGVKDPGTPVFAYGIDMGRVGSGMELNATGNTSYMRAEVVTPDQNAAVDFMFHAPRGFGVLTAQVIDYSTRSWWVTLNTELDEGTAQVSFDDPIGGAGPIGYSPTGILTALQDNQLHHCRLALETTGPVSLTWRLYIDGVEVDTGTSTEGLNGVREVRFRYSRYLNQTVTNMAHIVVWANASYAAIPSAAAAAAAGFGYVDDTAAARLERIADDGNIPIVITGTAADTTRMGPLYAEPRLAQLRDAEATDLGILHEDRASAALAYRTRRSMVGQTPALTLSFAGKQIKDPFEPIDDDQFTRNDVTASRREGGSYRAVVTSGRLSTQDPPNGVGLYDDEVTVNTVTDAQLAGIASWLVNRGTLDRARYSAIAVEIASADLDAATAAQVYAADVGDLLRADDLEELGEYEPVDLLILGYAETIGVANRDGERFSEFVFVCAPGELYRTSLYGTARYETGGSTLAAAVTSSATSLSLATAAGNALWTTDPASFPVDVNIGGERIRLTAITGATSPQAATAVRGINGVSKAHSAGAAVQLWDTPRYTL